MPFTSERPHCEGGLFLSIDGVLPTAIAGGDARVEIVNCENEINATYRITECTPSLIGSGRNSSQGHLPVIRALLSSQARA